VAVLKTILHQENSPPPSTLNSQLHSTRIIEISSTHLISQSIFCVGMDTHSSFPSPSTDQSLFESASQSDSKSGNRLYLHESLQSIKLGNNNIQFRADHEHYHPEVPTKHTQNSICCHKPLSQNVVNE
jgi:hypothetical protein